jgi:hypothetical protein
VKAMTISNILALVIAIILMKTQSIFISVGITLQVFNHSYGLISSISEKLKTDMKGSILIKQIKRKGRK